MDEPHDPLEHVRIECPYCGKSIEVAVYILDEVQDYVEDCHVCCHPIELRITRGDDRPVVEVRGQDE